MKTGQIFYLIVITQTLSLIGSRMTSIGVGSLVDYVLEPKVGQSGWHWVEPLVGDQAGAGMGLLLIVTGIIILVITLAMIGWPAFRRLELTLPDYAVVTEGVVPGG